MAVTVERLGDESILVATLTGEIVVDDVIEMYRMSAALIREDEDVVYRITDVRLATSDFARMFAIVRESSKGQPGDATDPRIKATVVGTNQWITFMRNAMNSPRFGNVQMAAFPSMDEALASIRIQMSLDKAL